MSNIGFCISPDLRNILRYISKKSVIAKFILEEEGYYSWIVQNSGMNFLDIDENGMFSFYSGRENIESLTYVDIEDMFFTKKGPWEKNRSLIKPGRYVKKLNGEFSNKEIEKFVDLIKCNAKSVGGNLEFRIVEGKEIAKVYKHGIMGSCMSGNSNDFFDIYVKNPNVCKMLVLYKGSLPVGRALLWKLHFDENIGSKNWYLDRIYCSDGYLFKKFEDWLEGRSDVLSYDERCVDIKVKLDNFGRFDKYPYLDTFKWYSWKKGILSSEMDSLTPSLELRTTYGKPNYEISIKDAYYNRFIDIITFSWVRRFIII